MTEIAVKVAVRVRPFNEREKQMGCVLNVDMQGSTTILTDLDDTLQERSFTFDYSYWSHDGFYDDENGVSQPDGPTSRYASQDLVYDGLGKLVLNNAWAGYHCCLFAYGQTGAGKSYSMVGYGNNKGIVPRSCDEIFQRISVNKDPGLEYDVVVSMLEIYNEKIQDLLIHPNKRPTNGLDVRESKEMGIYVANLTKCKVTSYAEIDAIVEQGTGNRTIGSTLMNATSSRAHTVLCIELRQLSHVGNRTGVKLSCIYLVDLAGSEKASKTGATGDRLKEGSAINKSLSCLGNVIEKLADQCSGKKTGVIPYRDSKLTRLLQNALGGSSFTVMICAISPASNNYAESLSTLRYADRAKKIKNATAVNEDPQDKLIRQLREENAKLKEMLEAGGGAGEVVKMIDESAMAAAKEAHEEEIGALEAALIEMQNDFERKLKAARAESTPNSPEKEVKEVIKEIVTVKEIIREVDVSVREKHMDLPHISILHEDPQLAGKLNYSFPPGEEVWMGRSDPKEGWSPGVLLAGVGIQKKHCRVTNEEKDGKRVVTLFAGDKAAVDSTFVNGDNFFFEGGEGCELVHGDRIVIGQNYVFVFVDHTTGEYCLDLINSGRANYEQAKKELAEKQGDLGGGKVDEEEMKRKEEEKKRMQDEYERKLKEAEEMKANAQKDMETMLKKREEEHAKQLKKMKKDMQHKAEKKIDEARKTMVRQQHEEDEEYIGNTEGELKKMQDEFAKKKREMEAKARREIKMLEKKQANLAAKEKLRKEKEADIEFIQEQLVANVPLVKEATALSMELGKPYLYTLRLHVAPNMEAAGKSTKNSRLMLASLFCVCRNSNGDAIFEWDTDTLENRVFLMRELFDHWCHNEDFDLTTLPLSRDPFWDPVTTEYLIGSCRVYLQPLIYQADVLVDAKLLGPDGKPADALLRIELTREYEKRDKIQKKEGQWDSLDLLEEECEDLAGKNFRFKIKVVRLRKMPSTFKSPRVEFQYYVDEKTVCRPKREIQAVNKSDSPEQVFDFQKVVNQDPVTERYLEYLKNGALQFSVFGHDKRAMELEKNQKIDEDAEAAKEEAITSPTGVKKSVIVPIDTVDAESNNSMSASNPIFTAAGESKGSGTSLADAALASGSVMDASGGLLSPGAKGPKKYEVVDKEREPSKACVIL